MKDMLLLLVHLLTTIAKLLGPGGARAVVADSLLLKQQLLIINRSRRRSPNLLAHDRFLLGLWSLFLAPRRILRAAIIIRPSTLVPPENTIVSFSDQSLLSPSCCDSGVAMVQATNTGKGNNCTQLRRLNSSGFRWIFVQRQMGPAGMIVVNIFSENPP